MTTERIRFAGTIIDTNYCNSSSAEFPDGYILLRIDERDTSVFPSRTLLLTGRRTPAVENGRYVIAEAVRKELINPRNGEKGVVFLVEILVTRESKEGRLLAEYHSKTS